MEIICNLNGFYEKRKGGERKKEKIEKADNSKTLKIEVDKKK